MAPRYRRPRRYPSHRDFALGRITAINAASCALHQVVCQTIVQTRVQKARRGLARTFHRADFRHLHFRSGVSMRIALLSYRSKPHCGGQGVYVRHLSRSLVELGHEVEVFSGAPYPDLDEGVRLTRVPSLDLYREPDPFRTPRLLEYRDLVDVEEVAM